MHFCTQAFLAGMIQGEYSMGRKFTCTSCFIENCDGCPVVNMTQSQKMDWADRIVKEVYSRSVREMPDE